MPEQTKRTKIKVISVGTPREVGTKGAKVTQFKGIDQTTQEETVYECWSSSLLEYIKPDTLIEADVTHSVNETDSGIYVHDKITQVYVDGQPVKTKGSWQPRGDSPEKIASIEGQNAATNVTNLIIAGKVGIGDALGKKVLAYLSNKLNGKVEVATKPTEEKATPPVEGVTKDQLATLKELKEEGSNLTKLIKGFNFGVTQIGDLTKAQAQTIINAETELPF